MTCRIPIINLNIYKSDIEKLLKCHVYEFFDPPRLASYRKQDSSRKDSTVNNWGEIIYLQSLTQTFNGVIFWTKLGKKSAKRQCKMSSEPPSLHKKSNSASFIKKCKQSLTVFSAPPKPYWWSVSKGATRRGIQCALVDSWLGLLKFTLLMLPRQ